MNFKLKADTISLIRYTLEEIYYLNASQTADYRLSRPTLFALTKKFTNKQLSLYKELPVNDKKRHKINFEIHEAVLLRGILITTIEEIDNQYSALLMNNFIEELRRQTTAF